MVSTGVAKEEEVVVVVEAHRMQERRSMVGGYCYRPIRAPRNSKKSFRLAVARLTFDRLLRLMLSLV